MYKSRPSRCMGVLTNCISAGHANCAMAAFMPGVEASESGIFGAR